jgi:hypothetical protein
MNLLLSVLQSGKTEWRPPVAQDNHGPAGKSIQGIVEHFVSVWKKCFGFQFLSAICIASEIPPHLKAENPVLANIQ